MIYFDNAATSFPKPLAVTTAMADFLAKDAANPGRAGHRMAVAAEEMIDDARLKLTRFFNGDDHRRMIFTLNCTDALNMAIKGVIASYGPNAKPHIVTTVLEHNSVSRPLQTMKDRGVIELTRVNCDAVGMVSPQAIKNALTDDTKLVVMGHASNALGTIQDVASVGQIVREHDLLFMVDGAQTAGIVPIDIEQMKIDLLAFPGHKSLLGPTGTGGLYVGNRVPAPAESATQIQGYLQPWREGGTGGDSATPTQPSLYPYFLEGGTPNTVGIAGLAAGLAYVKAHDMTKTLAHEQKMIQKLIDRFADDKRFTIYGTHDATKRVGTITFNIQGYEPSDIGSILDDSFEIAVRPGLHCAPYTHQAMGTFPTGSVRVSPGPFNTDEQIDVLIDALDQIAD